MEINDEAKEIVQQLCTAINGAVERSQEVSDAIERLRDEGYELELTLRLDIGLRQLADSIAQEDPTTLDLTDDDRRTLQRMKIRID